jgi:hypothetical protein
MAEETLTAQPGVDDEIEGRGAQLTIFEHPKRRTSKAKAVAASADGAEALAESWMSCAGG